MSLPAAEKNSCSPRTTGRLLRLSGKLLFSTIYLRVKVSFIAAIGLRSLQASFPLVSGAMRHTGRKGTTYKKLYRQNAPVMIAWAAERNVKVSTKLAIHRATLAMDM